MRQYWGKARGKKDFILLVFFFFSPFVNSLNLQSKGRSTLRSKNLRRERKAEGVLGRREGRNTSQVYTVRIKRIREEADQEFWFLNPFSRNWKFFKFLSSGRPVWEEKKSPQSDSLEAIRSTHRGKKDSPHLSTQERNSRKTHTISLTHPHPPPQPTPVSSPPSVPPHHPHPLPQPSP